MGHSEADGLISDIAQRDHDIPEVEKRAIISGLTSRVIDNEHEIRLSEEAAELLLRIALHPGDKKAFFLRFLKVKYPDLYVEASKPGGIDAHLLPTDIPWEVYRDYFRARHGVSLRYEDEVARLKACAEQVTIYVESLRQGIRSQSLFKENRAGDRERKLEVALLDALVYGQRVNEGMNGAIFRIDLENLPKEDAAIALDAGIFGERDAISAIKVLKVYRENAASSEYKNHRLVDGVLQDASRRGLRVASVPELYALHTIHLPNKEAHDAYKALTGMPDLSERVSCIGMEFIEGEDLGSFLWRQYGMALIRRCLQLGLSGAETMADALKALEYPSDYHYVRGLVDGIQKRLVALPEANHLVLEVAPPPRNDAERIKVFQASQRNMRRMISVLKADGFAIDRSIYQVISTTIQACRDAGIALLDCHERNIMITPRNEVVFIDFEKIRHVPRPIMGDGDVEAFYDMEMNPGGLPMDKGVLSTLRALIR